MRGAPDSNRTGSVSLEGLEDLARFRPAPELFLRENRASPGDDFEHPAGGRDEAERGNLAILGFEDLFRHTDGVRKVPSTRAVFDRDLDPAGHRHAHLHQ